MKWALGSSVLLAGALACVVWGSCAVRENDRLRSLVDSTLAVSARKDSLAQAEAQRGDSLQINAQTTARTSYVTRWRAETVWASLTPTATMSDSLRAATAVIGLLRESLDSLTVAFQAQRQAADQFRVAFEGERSRATDLEVALRKMPTGCPKVPLLGIPIPRVGVGYGVGTQGVGPVVAVIVPLGGC